VAGTITALEVQKRNKERVNVYLDGEFAFGLNLLDATRLRKGQTLTDPEIEALRERDEIAHSYDRAVAFLSYRPRSIAEIRQNLIEKKIDDAVIDAVIARLVEQGYVDDAAFARFWVGNRQEFEPSGARALRFELRQKGIASDVIDEVLAELDTSEAAYRAAKDKARRLRGNDKRTFRQKVGAILARRGFDYDTARTVTDRLIEEFSDEDAGFFTGRNDEHLE
jgi:regulatory protein